MALFKYYPPERISVLETGHLRFSPASEFNDPFDGLFVVENMDSAWVSRNRYEAIVVRLFQKEVDKNPEVPLTLSDFKRRLTYEQFLETQKKNMPKYVKQFHAGQIGMLSGFGVLCLSRTDTSAAMWAHYAKNHEGFLLEFDETHIFFQQFKQRAVGEWIDVTYDPKRPTWDFDSEKGAGFLKIKSPEWSYENETRLVIALASHQKLEPDDRNIKCLVACPPEALVSVTIGLKTKPETIRDVEEALLHPNLKHVRRLHASVDHGVYRLNREPGFER